MHYRQKCGAANPTYTRDVSQKHLQNVLSYFKNAVTTTANVNPFICVPRYNSGTVVEVRCTSSDAC